MKRWWFKKGNKYGGWNKGKTEKLILHKCKICNKEFMEYPCNERKFCSKKCFYTFRTGKLWRGKKCWHWKGGRTITTQGYVLHYVLNHPNKIRKNYIALHRLIIEKKIGRYLKPTEVIHHINGNKVDNRLENLMLFKNSAEHLKFHREVKNV